MTSEKTALKVMAEALLATWPNLGYAITFAMQNQRRKDAHEHNLVLGGIQFGTWETMMIAALDPDIGWGA